MRQAITVTNFNLILTYCPRIANVVANALLRKQEELKTQKEKNKVARIRAFLTAKQLNLNVIKAAANNLARLAAKGLYQTIKIAAADTFMS